MIHSTRIHSLNKLIKDQEELVWFDASNGEIIIAVLAIIKVKPCKFTFHQQQRNYLFNIRVWKMVAKINQGESFVTQFIHIQ